MLGATLGDAVSFWIGGRFGPALGRMWPLTRNPALLPRGIGFFAKYGGLSVFLGRFFGPVRAVIPLAAGIMQMPSLRFWIANVTSALIWAPMLVLLGGGIGKLGETLFGTKNLVVVILAAVTLFGVGGVVWALARSDRSNS